MTNVQPSVVDARKVTVSGVGIRPEGVPASLPISFKVDTRDAGPAANLDVLVQVHSLDLTFSVLVYGNDPRKQAYHF